MRASARSAAILERRGLGKAAAPIRRSMLEHAIALSYLSADPDGATAAYVRKRKHTLETNLLPAMLAGDWESSDDAKAALEAFKAEDERNSQRTTVQTHLLAFKHALEAYGDGDEWGVVYSYETDFSHPSWSTAFSDMGRDRMVRVTVLYLRCAFAFGGLLEGDAWTNHVHELSQALSLSLEKSTPLE